MRDQEEGKVVFDGKKSRLEMTDMMKEMGCVWFVVMDKETGKFVEWNMSDEVLEQIAKIAGEWARAAKLKSKDRVG